MQEEGKIFYSSYCGIVSIILKEIIMSRKKLIKLGISVLALNALGVAAHYTVPNFIPTVLAETPGEDEEIPDAEERKLVVNFTNKLNDFEGDIQSFEGDPSDEDLKALLEDSINELATELAVVKNGVKSPEGQASAAKLEARYNALVARANAALGKTTPTPPTPTETTKEVTETEEIPFTSREEKNADLPEGTRNIKTPGQKGEKTIVYTVTYVDGKETKREKKSETVTKQPVDKVIEIGTKKAAVITTKEVTEKEEIPFTKREEENPTLPEGTRNVKTPGEKGEKTIVYTVTYTDGVETKREKKSESVTKQPVEEVVEVGTKKAPVVTTKEVTEKQEVPFTSRTVENAELTEGTRNVKTPGEKGEKTIVYTVTYTDGVETSRVVKSENVTKQPVEEVIEVGTKKPHVPVVTTKKVEQTLELPYKVIRKENPALAKGEERRVTVGKKGQALIVEEITYTDGVETGRKELERKVLVEPVDEFIYYGIAENPVKPVNPVNPVNQVNPGKQEDPAKPADKVVALDRPATSPVVENKQALPNTGEKGTGILALLGATVLSMFGFLNRKKKG